MSPPVCPPLQGTTRGPSVTPVPGLHEPSSPKTAANTNVRSLHKALEGTRSGGQFRWPQKSHACALLACALASGCGSPDPRPWSARMRHRAPPLPVHPPHCPGTGDAWLLPSRVPSSPWAPEAALRLQVCRAKCARGGGARRGESGCLRPRHPCRGAVASGAPARHRLREPVPAAPPRHAPPLGRPLRGPAAR